MKRILFLFALISGFLPICVNTAYAQNHDKENIPITYGTGGVDNPTGLNQFDISFFAEFDSSTLTISVSNYEDEAEILIIRNPGHQVVYYSSESLFSSSPLDIDISSYPSGSYSICIILDNLGIYSGEFRIE